MKKFEEVLKLAGAVLAIVASALQIVRQWPWAMAGRPIGCYERAFRIFLLCPAFDYRPRPKAERT